MSQVQAILDEVLPALGVILGGEFLREPGVLAFFAVMKYQDAPSGKDADTVLEEIKCCTSYTIWCSIADDQLPFGPTLTIRGEGRHGKITVPWQHITAIVQLHERFKVTPMGFATLPGD
jgi:hypothetical protein